MDGYDIGGVLAPRSVAVIGASEDVGKFGGRVLHHLVKHAYAGTILPINPNRDSLFGLTAYPSITAAPGPVDVAVIALPVAQLAGNIRACAEAGVRVCAVITAGLAEAGPEGRLLQDEIVAIARSHGMRLLGPNCLGFVNTRAGLALTSSFAMGVDRLTPGPVGIVSQSGALMATMFNFGYDRGVSFSKLVSVGNQADLTLEDFFEHLIDDPDTRAVALYVESLAQPARFRALLAAAKAKNKPVVVVKAGRGDAGARAALSHTAGLAGSFRAFAAVLESEGAVLSDDPEAAVTIADALARWGRRRTGGIAVASGSGGGAALSVDRLEQTGFPLAGDGPVDLGSLPQAFAAATIRNALERVVADPATGALLYLMTTQPLMRETALLLAELGWTSGKPVLLVLSAGSVADDVRQALREQGYPYFDRSDDALRVLRAFEWKEHGRPSAPPKGHGLEPLLERESKTLLVDAGILTTRESAVRDAAHAVAAAADIGFPVVLKLSSRAVSHKSDIGGVRLGVANAAAVREAFADLRALVPEEDFDGVLVQEQVSGVAELIVGAKWDDQFGPFVLVGSGGVFAEIIADTRIAPAPVGEEQALRLIESLRIAPVLAGARGRPAADVRAAAAVVTAVGRLAATLGPRLRELDINPLILRAEFQGAVAVDARAVLDGVQTVKEPA